MRILKILIHFINEPTCLKLLKKQGKTIHINENVPYKIYDLTEASKFYALLIDKCPGT